MWFLGSYQEKNCMVILNTSDTGCLKKLLQEKSYNHGNNINFLMFLDRSPNRLVGQIIIRVLFFFILSFLCYLQVYKTEFIKIIKLDLPQILRILF